jgi:hypothetical protein
MVWDVLAHRPRREGVMLAVNAFRIDDTGRITREGLSLQEQ